MSEIATRDDALPWEKRKGEAARSFQNFAMYRDLGPARTIRKAAEALGKSIDTLQAQSAKYEWVSRAEAYDAHVDRRMREARETELERARRNEAGLAALMLDPVFARLTGREGKNGDAVKALNANELGAADVARLAEAGVKIGRLARGAPTDLVRGAFAISSTDVEKIARDLVEISLRFIPEDAQPRYEAEIRAYSEGGIGG